MPTISIGALTSVARSIITSEAEVLESLTWENPSARTEEKRYFSLATLTEDSVQIPRALDPRPYLRPGASYDVVSEILDPETWPVVKLGEDRIQLGPNEHIAYDQRPAWEALSRPRSWPYGRILVMGCIDGEAVVTINRGGASAKVPLAEAYQHQQRRDRTRAFLEAENRIGLTDVLKIFDRGMRFCLELRLVDGRALRLTPDHEVLVGAGDHYVWVKTRDLKVGDLVITDATQPPGRKPKWTYKRLAWDYPGHPFAHKNGLRDGQHRYVLEEHRAIAEATLNGLSLAEYRDRFRRGEIDGLRFIDPSRYHVHHRDHDHTNNHPDNLEVLLVEDHLQEHRPGASAFGQGIPTPVAVADVVEAGMVHVYDIACDVNHSFVANGIVVHNCGKGKTICALKLAHLRAVPTIVVCHTLNMVQKWSEEAERWLAYPRELHGFIGDGKVDWEGRNLVFATMPGLICRDYPADFWRQFGLAIFDEGDLLGATELSRILPKFLGERVLVTATPRRSDGNDRLYSAHVGPVVFHDVNPDLAPRCYVLDSPVPARYMLPDKSGKRRSMKTVQAHAWNPRAGRPVPHVPRTISRIVHVRERREWTLDLVCGLAQDDRKVLFLGERVGELMGLHSDFACLTPFVSGLALGKKHMRPEEIAENLKRCQVIWGIQQIAQRGLDERSIDTIIIQYAAFAEPNRLQQTAGRGLRFMPGKREPLLIILNDRNVPVLHDKTLALVSQLRDRWGYDVTWLREGESLP